MRSWDAYKTAEAIEFYLKSHELVDPIEWLADPENICLTNDLGDFAFFERGVRHIYTGHYFFKSRGRQAITVARAFIDELFNTCYNIHVLMGLSPLDNKGARWLSRQVGFKSYGVEEIASKHYEVFIITKKEFNNE